MLLVVERKGERRQEHDHSMQPEDRALSKSMSKSTGTASFQPRCTEFERYGVLSFVYEELP